jgi:hypothetical protein
LLPLPAVKSPEVQAELIALEPGKDAKSIRNQ